MLNLDLSWLERLHILLPGQQGYQDDLRDQWRSYAHRHEWSRFVEQLFAFAVRTGTAVAVLSGEIHLRCFRADRRRRYASVRMLYSISPVNAMQGEFAKGAGHRGTRVATAGVSSQLKRSPPVTAMKNLQPNQRKQFMDLNILRDEYDLARRYTHSLYEDLSEADVQWRPVPKSSSIAWHLGHQAAAAHALVRNFIEAEASLNPRFDVLFDAANPQENRGDLPPLAEIVTYRGAVTQRLHVHFAALLEGGRPAAHAATQQLGRIIVPIVLALINHEYQHDCWIREMRVQLGHAQPDEVFSSRAQQVDGYWGLQGV